MPRFGEILFNLIALFVAVYIGVDIFYRFVNAEMSPVKAWENAAGAVSNQITDEPLSLAHYHKISQRGLLGGRLSPETKKRRTKWVLKKSQPLNPQA